MSKETSNREQVNTLVAEAFASIMSNPREYKLYELILLAVGEVSAEELPMPTQPDNSMASLRDYLANTLVWCKTPQGIYFWEGISIILMGLSNKERYGKGN